ncbi:hypothetical protein NTG1052_360029 [Candidatus Nitrotoga sp. 1052]|nr:hypothetical protein NTG1052_360029 [Candidatus Nitrotoga sp. 1052]
MLQARAIHLLATQEKQTIAKVSKPLYNSLFIAKEILKESPWQTLHKLENAQGKRTNSANITQVCALNCVLQSKKWRKPLKLATKLWHKPFSLNPPVS